MRQAKTKKRSFDSPKPKGKEEKPMKPETLVMLTLIAAILQVVIQFLGVAKAFME